MRDDPDALPDVTVVIVSFNTAHLLDRLFAALDAGRGALRLQIIVVDNASRDESVEILRARHPTAELIVNEVNVGFGRANNQAVPLARGRYVLLLNTDAFVSPDTLPTTVNYMDRHPRCGVLGVTLLSEDGSLQPSCRFFPTPWNVFLQSTGLKRFFPRARLVDDPDWDPARERACDWVPGAYYLVRRDVIARVGLFDPRFFLYYEEVDHCRAVKQAGWEVVYFPNTSVIHLGGESAESEGKLDAHRQVPTLQIESELLYFRKHHGLAGMAFAVFLMFSSGVAKAFNAAARRRDGTKALSRLRHVAAVLRALVRTRLASQPTR